MILDVDLELPTMKCASYRHTSSGKPGLSEIVEALTPSLQGVLVFLGACLEVLAGQRSYWCTLDQRQVLF